MHRIQDLSEHVKDDNAAMCSPVRRTCSDICLYNYQTDNIKSLPVNYKL